MFDARVRLYVHAHCAKIMQLALPSNRGITSKSRVQGIPHGLKQRSLTSYTTEWERYSRFVARRGLSAVPGKDVPWDLALLTEYMEWRAETCKPSTLAGVFSILAHFGAIFGFLLPNSRDDHDSLGYRRIRNIKRQLAIDGLEAAGDEGTAPSRCTPLGNDDVSLLLSAFGAISRARFAKIPRRHRHHLACVVMQHVRGMRYGHFIYRAYTIDQFKFNPKDGSFVLLTDWSRYAGRSKFCLKFEAFPKLDCLRYTLRASDGTVVDTVAAATVLSWHFDILRQENESKIFAPANGEAASREDRAKWLRESLLAALPLDEHDARRLVDQVTPHSFRPGLAGDMRQAGLRLDEIAIECRWLGLRNARTYSARRPLSASRISTAFRLIAL